jgi:hypothetical protein
MHAKGKHLFLMIKKGLRVFSQPGPILAVG